jgi:hypothetical protein
MELPKEIILRIMHWRCRIMSRSIRRRCDATICKRSNCLEHRPTARQCAKPAYYRIEIPLMVVTWRCAEHYGRGYYGVSRCERYNTQYWIEKWNPNDS